MPDKDKIFQQIGIFLKIVCISRLTADRMMVEITLFEEQDETEKIREDIQKIKDQIEGLRGATQ